MRADPREARAAVCVDCVDVLGGQLVHVEVRDVACIPRIPSKARGLRPRRRRYRGVDVDRQHAHAEAGVISAMASIRCRQGPRRCRAAVPEALGVAGCNNEARRLLEAVARNTMGGEGTGLGARRLAQGQLGEDCDHELRVEAGARRADPELGQRMAILASLVGPK